MANSIRSGGVDDEEPIRLVGVDLILTSKSTARVSYVVYISGPFSNVPSLPPRFLSVNIRQYLRGVLLTSLSPPRRDVRIRRRYLRFVQLRSSLPPLQVSNCRRYLRGVMLYPSLPPLRVSICRRYLRGVILSAVVTSGSKETRRRR